VIRKRFHDDTIALLLAIRWWDWPPEKIVEQLGVLRQGDVALLERRGTAS
jgi:virginiamycin A acetyltransferase